MINDFLFERKKKYKKFEVKLFEENFRKFRFRNWLDVNQRSTNHLETISTVYGYLV